MKRSGAILRSQVRARVVLQLLWRLGCSSTPHLEHQEVWAGPSWSSKDAAAAGAPADCSITVLILPLKHMV
jgi:hypothetical protein